MGWRWPGGRSAYSGMSSIRRYSGLTNLLLIGWYGDGLTGGTGSAACSGLISTKAAPRPRLLHAARSARSRRSPWPQDRRGRTQYRLTVDPPPPGGGGGWGSTPGGRAPPFLLAARPGLRSPRVRDS